MAYSWRAQQLLLIPLPRAQPSVYAARPLGLLDTVSPANPLTKSKCAIIETAFPKKTYSSSNQKNLYRQFVNSYFSVNDRLKPSCAVSPANTQDVAAIVGLLAKSSCQFAVKSGGHGLLTASSNIAKGVTMDLRAMRSISLNKRTKTATLQPGAKWIEVYKYLDAMGFAIPGGRAGDVGVGGLITGGTSIETFGHCGNGSPHVADNLKEATLSSLLAMGLSAIT